VKALINTLKKQAKDGIPQGEDPVTSAQVTENLCLPHKIVMDELIPVVASGGISDLGIISQDVSTLQNAVATIPALPNDFISSWRSVKTSAAKISSTFSSTTFNEIKAGVEKIPVIFTIAIFNSIKVSEDKIHSKFDVNTLITMKTMTDKIPTVCTSSSLAEMNTSIKNVIHN
jgi:hypothetical protein